MLFNFSEFQTINLKGKRVRIGETRMVTIAAHEVVITNGSGRAAAPIMIYGDDKG